MAEVKQHPDRQFDINLVITAAAGFKFKYDSSIKHLTYHLEDKKSENIAAYFDMAAFQIDKRTMISI